MRPALLIASLVGCRVDHIGLPVDTGEWIVDGPVWDDTEIAPGCTTEVEPNDLQAKDSSDFDWMGLVHEARFARYCGTISRPDDLDTVAFQLLQPGRITVVAVPQSSGNVDLLVIDTTDKDQILVPGGGPWSGRLPAGVHVIVVASAGGATPEYRLDLMVE